MKLEEFLVRVKQNTYTSAGEEEDTLTDGSKELLYEEGDFKYRDRYFGSETFAGEEKIFFKEQKIYQLNYPSGLIN